MYDRTTAIDTDPDDVAEVAIANAYAAARAIADDRSLALDAAVKAGWY